MRSPEMRKNRRLRSVCAPHSRSDGTSIGPKLSFSVRVPLIAAVMLLLQLRKIEHQDFGVPAVLELDSAAVGLERIASAELVAVDRQAAARHVDVALAALAKRKQGALRAVEQAGVDARVLVDLHRAVDAVGRHDEPQPAALFLRRELLLLVRRRDPGDVGLDPDLQEMRHARFVVVVLAVQHPAPGAHPLHVARYDGRAVTHRIPVAERAFEHVADDFHVAVAMRADTRASLHPVLVEHAQHAVAHMARILVIREREAVVRIEPAVIGMAALGAASRLDHAGSLLPFFFTSSCTFAMSSDFAWLMTCSSADPGSAPACWNRITFSRNTISVGIERMPKVPASACCSSVLTLANTTSGWASEACS